MPQWMNKPKRASRHQVMRWSCDFIDSRHQASSGLFESGTYDAGTAAGGCVSRVIGSRLASLAAATAAATVQRAGPVEVSVAAGLAPLACMVPNCRVTGCLTYVRTAECQRISLQIVGN